MLYGLIFYLLFYYSLAFWKPEFLVIPSQLSSEYIVAVTLVFTMIVILAYVGASYVLLGRLPSVPKAISQKKLPKKRPPLQAEPQESQKASGEDSTKITKVSPKAAHTKPTEASILAPRKALLPKAKESKEILEQEAKPTDTDTGTEAAH